MELDNGIRLAVILSWDDLLRTYESPSVRVEYQREAGTNLDYLSVWSDRPKGYQFLICNYSATPLRTRSSEVHFANGYQSDQLTQNLRRIMNHQDQFTLAPGGGRNGLILIGRPSAEDRAEASAWKTAGDTASGQDIQVAPVKTERV